MRFVSRNTSSTARASLSHCAAHSPARALASTWSRGITRPSALLTIFCVTSSTSPASSGVSWARSPPSITAARSSPERTSGKPRTGKTW